MKHWLNAPEVRCMFITTTVRGWTPIFERPEMRDALVACILDDHRHYHAILHAFAAMTHHFHTVSVMTGEMTCSWFMERLKSNATKRLMPLLNSHENQQLDQAPASGNLMWQQSFRGVPITSTRARITKVNYVHLNAVRASFVEVPEDYRWSSARFRTPEFYDVELGLRLDLIAGEFGPPPPFPRYR